MPSAVKIPAAMLLLTVLMLGAMLLVAAPQNAFGAKYWGDTDTVDEALGSDGETVDYVKDDTLDD